MQRNRTINFTGSPEEAQRRADDYLERAGYKRLEREGSYQRGSSIGSLTGFTPKRWKVDVTVSPPAGESVDLRFDINTTGQAVTRRENAFWDMELDELDAAISSGNVTVGESTQANRGTLKQNRALIIAMGVAALVAGIISGLMGLPTWLVSGIVVAMMTVGLRFLGVGHSGDS
jgi:hypothetical protein